MLNTHLKLSNQWLLVGKTDSVYFRGKRLVFINCPNYFSRYVRKGGGSMGGFSGGLGGGGVKPP